jgi:cyanate permease
MNQPDNRQPYRWAMLFGVWLVYTTFGMAVYSSAPLVGPITRDLGMSLGAMGTVMGAWPLVYIGMAVPAGALLDRIGVRPALLIATALITASVALRAAAGGFGTLFLAVAVFGIGGPLVSVGAPKLISAWFEGKERGIAVGVYSTGPTIGAVVVLSLTNGVFMPLTDQSWRLTLLIYAGLAALAGLTWLAISSRPAARLHDPGGGGRGSLHEQLQVFSRLLRLGPVRIVLGIAIGVFMFNHALNNWLPEILRHGGMSAVQAGLWASIPSLVGTAAALTLPRYATRHRRIGMLVATIGFGAIATLLIAFANGGWLALGLCLQGIARGSMIPITMLVLMETKDVDSRVMGAAGGLFFAAAETGGVLGPMMTGWFADATGGFTAALVTLTVICIACIGLVLILQRHIRLDAQS